MLKPLIHQLASSLGIETLAESPDGSYLLKFEPEIDVTFHENSERSSLILRSSIRSLSKKHSEKVMLTLLSANLFGRETGNASFGVDKEGKEIVLQEFLPDGISYKSFHDAVELFVNYASVWKEDIVRLEEEEG